jgi:phosphatidylglycerol lysyltransferase
MEALIARSVDEAKARGIEALSLGVAPRVITARDTPSATGQAWRAVYWGLDRFQRSRTLRRFKEKFGPTWEPRYLVVPSASALPEVMVALARAHVPTFSAAATWLRTLAAAPRLRDGRRAVA